MQPGPGDKAEKTAMEAMNRIGRDLLAQARAEAEHAEKTGSSDFKGRDLFSLLVRANMATDLPERLRMSDEDVLSRAWPSFLALTIPADPISPFPEVPTFMVAGHETTATGTTWAIHQLTQNPAVQSRLREELTTWINLHLHNRVSGVLLILGRAFFFDRTPGTDEDGHTAVIKSLEAVLSSLPDNLLNEAEIEVDEAATYKQKLEVLQQQQELIEDEEEQEEKEELARRAKREAEEAEAMAAESLLPDSEVSM